MSQPYQPQQPGQQPQRPMGPPPQMPPGSSAYAPAGKPPKRKRFGFLALGLAALIGMFIGGPIGAASNSETAAPAPAATVTATTTVTETAAAAPVEGDPPFDEPTEEPEPEPEPTTEEPAAYEPSKKDWKVSIKVTDKQCFGSAGCNITYKVGLDYLGDASLPDEGKTSITYEVDGAEGPIIGTLEVDGEGMFSVDTEIASTTSSSKKLAAKVTEVEYNEYG